MLFELLRQTVERINQLDPERDGPIFLQQVSAARPDFDEQIRQAARKAGMSKEVTDTVRSMIGMGGVSIIKQIPTIVETMVDHISGQNADPALRCAVVGALAYLVQPHDIIPDDAPGGYGYVDDDVILRVALIEYLSLLPSNASEAERQRDYYQMGASTVPLAALPALRVAVDAMATTFQILRVLPPELLELTTQLTIANPLQATTPEPRSGFSPSMPPQFDTGRWSGGAYFEGGNVIMPGGPSLIGGELFIPD